VKTPEGFVKINPQKMIQMGKLGFFREQRHNLQGTADMSGYQSKWV
jgi:hypothetical protein